MSENSKANLFIAGLLVIIGIVILSAGEARKQDQTEGNRVLEQYTPLPLPRREVDGYGQQYLVTYCPYCDGTGRCFSAGTHEAIICPACNGTGRYKFGY